MIYAYFPSGPEELSTIKRLHALTTLKCLQFKGARVDRPTLVEQDGLRSYIAVPPDRIAEVSAFSVRDDDQGFQNVPVA